MNKKHLLTLSLIGAVALSGMLSACSGEKKDAPSTSESKPDGKSARKAEAKVPVAKEALTITVENPKLMTVTNRASFNGSVAAWQEASVAAEVAGLRIAQVTANIGDTVRKGQLLARLDDASVRAEFAAQRAAVADAQAQLADAKANAERARQLDKTGAISAAQIEQLLTMEKTAKARLDAALARQSSDAIRLANAKVVAPEDGVITAKTAVVGAVVQPGVELFRLIRNGRIELRAEVPATELGKIKPKQEVLIDAGSGLQAKGTVRTISPTVDPQTRNAVVYVDIPAGTGLKAGMFAKGSFDLGSAQSLTLPASAVVKRDGFDSVFVLEAGNKVKWTKVQVGNRSGDRIEVKGLEANANVAVTGANFLNDGDLVRVVK